LYTGIAFESFVEMRSIKDEIHSFKQSVV